MLQRSPSARAPLPIAAPSLSAVRRVVWTANQEHPSHHLNKIETHMDTTTERKPSSNALLPLGVAAAADEEEVA